MDTLERSAVVATTSGGDTDDACKSPRPTPLRTHVVFDQAPPPRPHQLPHPGREEKNWGCLHLRILIFYIYIDLATTKSNFH